MVVVQYWLLAVPKVVNVWLFNLDNRFAKHYRLLKTEDFSSVFVLRKQRSRQFIQIFWLSQNTREYARIGLVVSKKVAKRANRRNFMKRVIREWFRQHKYQLSAHDFVIRVRKPFERKDVAIVVQELTEMMVRQR